MATKQTAKSEEPGCAENLFEENLRKLNVVLSESGSLDRFLRVFAYGSLLIKGLLLTTGLKEQDYWARLFSDLYFKLGTTRFVLHIFGGPALLQTTLNAYRAAKKKQASTNSDAAYMAVLKFAAMTLYFPCEHMIFISRLNPNIFGTDDALWLRRTCICWLVFNICALIESVENHATSLVQSIFALDSILAYSWSLKNPFLGPIGIGTIGTWGGAVGFYLSWKSIK